MRTELTFDQFPMEKKTIAITVKILTHPPPLVVCFRVQEKDGNYNDCEKSGSSIKSKPPNSFLMFFLRPLSLTEKYIKSKEKITTVSW